MNSKLFDFVSSSDLLRRLDNFVTIELQSRDQQDSPFIKIEKKYYELLYNLKKRVVSTEKTSQILNPIVEFSIFVLRTILKSIKSYDERKSQHLLMKIANMDPRVGKVRTENSSQQSRFFSPKGKWTRSIIRIPTRQTRSL